MSIEVKPPKWVRASLKKLSGKLIATMLIFLFATLILTNFLITTFDRILNNPDLTLAMVALVLVSILAMFNMVVNAIMKEKEHSRNRLN